MLQNWKTKLQFTFSNGNQPTNEPGKARTMKSAKQLTSCMHGWLDNGSIVGLLRIDEQIEWRHTDNGEGQKKKNRLHSRLTDNAKMWIAKLKKAERE